MKKERVYLNALVGEITYNLPILKTNLHNLSERKSLEKDEITFNPLYSIELDVWNSINLNIPIDALKINYPEFYTFVYDSRRFNQTLQQRNLIPLSPNFIEPIKEYNQILTELCTCALEHLVNVLETRGKLVKIKIDNFQDYDSLINMVKSEGIKNPESLGNFIETIEYCISDGDWEIFIFQYIE